MRPLDRLRLRLTAWYIGTFGLILVLLMSGLFVVIEHQLRRQLEDSLHDATAELIRAARIRQMESVSARGTIVDAVDELHIPGRQLFLLDVTGRPVKPTHAPAWAEHAALAAARSGVGVADGRARAAHGPRLEVHAERFSVAPGTVDVAVVAADRVELEDRYASLIGAFGGAELAALVLVAAGGYVLVRKSTAPVERTMEYMRRFMADAAHELRTPITVLRSRAEVALQRTRDPADYADALRGVARESERLSRIVDDLLILARADAGERAVRREHIYLDDITDDAAQAARALAEQYGVTLVIDRFEEAAMIGDPDLVRQLVMIVLDNAIKFTPAGGRVGVAVSSSNDGSGSAGCAMVEVTDTGVGIAPDQLPHVFERFYRGDAARARVAERLRPDGHTAGAGLGLAIARWIADAHGATIDITSEVERGTRVVVRFPSLV